MPTPVEDDEGMVEIDDGMRERRQRFQSTASTLEEPDTEMIPGSRRRSREQENILDDVPISFRRRISGSAATESRAPVPPEGTSSQPTESQASPLAESMERAGTTGAGLDLMSEGWNIKSRHDGRLSNSDKLSETRITEMAFCDGGNKRRHETWDEGSCVNMDGEWTGKTIFVLKSTVKEKRKEQDEVRAFLAERSLADMSKSGKKKAVGKQFNYEMETEETRKGIDGSRRDEREKWQKFMADQSRNNEGLGICQSSR